MARSDVYHPGSGGGFVTPDRQFARFFNHIRTGVRRLVKAYRNRRQVAELLSWDDRRLADIGLTRTDVELAMGMPVSQDPSMQLQRWALERRSAHVASRREARAAADRAAGPTGQGGQMAAVGCG